MLSNPKKEINVALNAEIETVVVVYARLPDILLFKIFFGSQRWMVEIATEICGLFSKLLLNLRRKLYKTPAEIRGIFKPHAFFVFCVQSASA